MRASITQHTPQGSTLPPGERSGQRAREHPADCLLWCRAQPDPCRRGYAAERKAKGLPVDPRAPPEKLRPEVDPDQKLPELSDDFLVNTGLALMGFTLIANVLYAFLDPAFYASPFPPPQ